MSEKEYFEGKTVWITGGSSGIGEALAKRLTRTGSKVIISSNEENELERVKKELAEEGFHLNILPFDLSKPEEVMATAEKALSEFKRIDFLFNNGGVSTRITSLETSVETDRKVMEINYFAGLILTKKILPGMIERGFGHIITTSSISGKFGFPLRSAYAASKHALHGFYESVWTEYHTKGIRVTLVCPGRVKTNISVNAIGRDGKGHGKMDPGQAGGISPEICAKRILKAVRKNRKEVFVGGKELLMAYIKQYSPFLFYRLVTRINPK